MREKQSAIDSVQLTPVTRIKGHMDDMLAQAARDLAHGPESLPSEMPISPLVKRFLASEAGIEVNRSYDFMSIDVTLQRFVDWLAADA